MKPIGRLSYPKVALTFIGLIVFFYIGMDMSNDMSIPTHGPARGIDPQIWGPVGIAFILFLAVSALPLLIVCLFRRGVGLLVRNGRLVYPVRFRSIPLDQIVSVAAETRIPIGSKPDTIKIGLANGRDWRINATPFKTSITDMIASIEAHAPGMRKSVGDDASLTQG